MYDIPFWIAWYQNIFQQGDENITTLSELEFKNTFETLINDSSINSWLPPFSISMSKFNATGTYVDNEGQIYFQCSDNDIPQLLQNVKDELNFIFMNSEPEPINFKWSNGQMVIVKYHLDNLWYRGIILEVKEDELFSVQFIDYGNTEDCSRDNLRSTLYMTDIPQLCVMGFLYNIVPVTKNNKWSTSTLDFIHCLVVDKNLEITVDLEKSYGNIYAIKSLKSSGQPDVCQYLVSNNHAYFTCVDKSKFLFFGDPMSNDTTENYDSTESNIITENYDSTESNIITENNDTLSEHSTLKSEECYNCNDNSNNSIQSGYTNSIDYEEINNRILQSINTNSEQKFIGNREISFINAYNFNTHVNPEENDKKDESNYFKNKLDYESDTVETKDDEEELDNYSKFCLELGDELEGTLSTIVEPTRMTLMITKIGGVSMSKSKDKMHRIMFEKCPLLPLINQITPGIAVVVLHNILWRRGLIVDGGNSVLLVDLGVKVKLNKNNVRLCPKEFFHLPMLSIDCQLENIKISENANPKDIINTMSNLLKGVKLKIVGKDKLDEDILGVELYNDNGEIAYQPLIDNKLLIRKN